MVPGFAYLLIERKTTQISNKQSLTPVPDGVKLGANVAKMEVCEAESAFA